MSNYMLITCLENKPFSNYPFRIILVPDRYNGDSMDLFGQQLLAIANGMTHTDWESFEGALTEWFEHWGSYINERTISDNGQSFYTHRRLRTAARSLRRNMDVLWTFYTYPELKLPNTNNAMESFWRIGQLSLRGWKLIGVHNGLSVQHKRAMIDAYIMTYNADK